jgi:hypothetical protein
MTDLFQRLQRAGLVTMTRSGIARVRQPGWLSRRQFTADARHRPDGEFATLDDVMNGWDRFLAA